LGGIVIDLGEVTTPQLHHAVYYHKKHNLAPVEGMNSKIFQDHYDRMLLEGYNELIETIPSTTETKLALFGDGLIIDASCGVGSIALSSLLPNLVSFNQSGENTFYEVCNESGSGPVNEDCGAELVQKNRTLPRNVNTVNGRNKLMCSLDGDADRIVFHYFLPVDDTLLSPEPSDVQWILLDGDKIAGIISLFLIKEIEETPLIAMGFTIGTIVFEATKASAAFLCPTFFT
jgi:phosphoacetylglucosamine mutase